MAQDEVLWCCTSGVVKGRTALRLDPEKVRRARESLGYSIESVGEKGELSPNSVLRAEHGEEIRPSTARRLARALNTEVADLYPKAEAPTSPTPSKAVGEERRTAGADGDELFAGQSRRQAAIEEAQEAIGDLLKRYGVQVRYHTMPHKELDALYDAPTTPEEAKTITDEVWEERRKLDELCPDLRSLPGYPIHAALRTRATAAAGMLRVLRREEQQFEEDFEREVTSPSPTPSQRQ
jgi:transcriptional regulator with XRE-family HTH domain